MHYIAVSVRDNLDGTCDAILLTISHPGGQVHPRLIATFLGELGGAQTASDALQVAVQRVAAHVWEAGSLD